MEREKDQGKRIVPLFPARRNSEEDEQEPRPPPSRNKNKRALYEEHNVNSQTSEFRSIPRPLLPISSSSSANVSGLKPRVGVIRHSYTCGGESTSGLTMKAKCISSVPPPPGYVSYRNSCADESDRAVSSFHQPHKNGDLQLFMKKGKETTSGMANLGEESSSKASVAGNRIRKHGEDEMSRSSPPRAQLCLELKSLHKSKSVAEDMFRALGGEELRTSSSDAGLTKEGSNDSFSLRIGDADETSDANVECCVPGGGLTPDEVVRLVGVRLYFKARKTMVHQQKIFSLQKFELHRLIKVQQHIARSPEILQENSPHPNKPSIKFPPISELLYVASLDPSPTPLAKPKIETPKSDLATECGAEALLPLPTSDAEKGHLATTKSLTNPTSIPMDPKLSPWCFPAPTGNQWLLPVRSPSEGLIFKPYPGSCFPTASSFMPPVHGNCAPIGLSLLGDGATQSDKHASESFCGTELSHTFLQPRPMNPSCPNPELKLAMSSTGAQEGELEKTSSTGNNFFLPSRASSQQTAVVSDLGESETKPPERLEGDALSLFPTTPSLQAERDEQRVQAIKVVPHNRKLASASAARIFQSIQEERRKLE